MCTVVRQHVRLSFCYTTTREMLLVTLIRVPHKEFPLFLAKSSELKRKQAGGET
jgi:hypothetical protein